MTRITPRTFNNFVSSNFSSIEYSFIAGETNSIFCINNKMNGTNLKLEISNADIDTVKSKICKIINNFENFLEYDVSSKKILKYSELKTLNLPAELLYNIVALFSKYEKKSTFLIHNLSKSDFLSEIDDCKKDATINISKTYPRTKEQDKNNLVYQIIDKENSSRVILSKCGNKYIEISMLESYT